MHSEAAAAGAFRPAEGAEHAAWQLRLLAGLTSLGAAAALTLVLIHFPLAGDRAAWGFALALMLCGFGVSLVETAVRLLRHPPPLPGTPIRVAGGALVVGGQFRVALSDVRAVWNFKPPGRDPEDGYYAVIVSNHALTRKSREGAIIVGHRWVERPDAFEAAFKGVCEVRQTAKPLPELGHFRLMWVRR